MKDLLNLIYIFIRPRRVFERVKDKPDYLYPLITIITVQVISTLRSVSMMSAKLNIPVNKGLLMFISSFASIIGVLLELLFLWIIFVIAILILGKREKYKNLFSVILYGYLPNSLILLIRAIVGLPGRGRGISVILSDKASPYLFALLSRVDIFYIWSIALIIFGISVLYGLKRREVLILILIFLIYFFITPLLFKSQYNEASTIKNQSEPSRRGMFPPFLRRRKP